MTVVTCLSLVALSCGAVTPDNILSKILSGVKGSSSSTSSTTSGTSTGSSAIDGLLNLVVGSVKLSESDIVGTWNYSEPACAFTSENLLAKAGGSVAAETVNGKLLPAYKSAGIKSDNTYFTFDSNKKVSAKIKGVPLNGSYTFDSSSSTIKMKFTLITLTAYLTRTTNGMSFTFESKKILTLLQTIAKVSGNSTLKTVGDLSKSYDGIRIGFDMKKSK